MYVDTFLVYSDFEKKKLFENDYLYGQVLPGPQTSDISHPLMSVVGIVLTCIIWKTFSSVD